MKAFADSMCVSRIPCRLLQRSVAKNHEMAPGSKSGDFRGSGDPKQGPLFVVESEY